MLQLNRLFAREWVPFLMIGLATVLVWGHTVKFDFVWDDQQFIQELQSIRSLKNIPEMFSSLEAQSSYPEGFKLFRPLRTAHYALLFWLGGKDSPQPWLYHLANLLWHMGVCLLLYPVGRLLVGRTVPNLSPERARWLGFWVALAFALHPIVSEVVCWAKSLDDAMAAVFTLAALWALLAEPRVQEEPTGSTTGQPVSGTVPPRYGQALFWFVLAVYSKISAVPFALVVFPIFYLVRKMPLRRALWLSAGFGAVAFVFMVHRHLVIGQSSQTAPLSGTYAQTLLDMFPVVAQYLRLLCGVPPFCIDYSYMPGHHSLFSPAVLGGVVLLGVAVGLMIWMLRKPALQLPALGLLWIGAFLIPVSNLLPMMQYMAERFLYLPLIGWLWLLAFVLGAGTMRPARVAVAGLLLVAWAGLAWNRSLLWQDNLTLFVQSVQQGPRSKRLEDNAVAAIFKLPHVQAMFTLDARQGTLHAKSLPPGQAEAIENTLRQAHQLLPQDDTVSSALAILYAQAKKYEQALPLFQLAVQRHPENARHWVNLARVNLDMNSLKSAEAALKKALALSPENPEALRVLARLEWQQQSYPAVLRTLHRLKQLHPESSEYDQWIQETEARLKPAQNSGVLQ